MKTFSVTEILQYHSTFEDVPRQWLMLAQERGTKVHAWCTAYVRHLFPESLAPEYSGYAESFKRWYDLGGYSTIFSEGLLKSKTFPFHGHPDLVVKMETKDDMVTVTRKRLIDIKTGSEQKTWFLQLSAYWYLLKENGIEVDEAGALILDSNGELPRYIPHPRFIIDFSIFHCEMQVYQYLHPIK